MTAQPAVQEALSPISESNYGQSPQRGIRDERRGGDSLPMSLRATKRSILLWW